MAKLIAGPTVVECAGNLPKKIEEYVGRVNSETDEVSIARMKSPPGWIEPGQTPEFDEYTLVLLVPNMWLYGYRRFLLLPCIVMSKHTLK